jgi:transglutaminase-like putative cysteine protease
MQYHWGGDFIYRDTRLPNKRFVIGSPQTPVETDIREWLQYAEDQVLLKALATIPGMPDDSAWGSFDRRALLVWDYVARHVRYNFDKDRQGYDDFWLFPDETISLAVGDCEDSAILLAAMLLAAGISPYCVRVVLGKLFDANGVLLGAHAWTVYQDESGVWRLLEATLDAAPSALPSADALAMPGGRHIYWPEFCFNDRHLWWVRTPNRPDAMPPRGLDEYLLRTAMAGVVNAEMRPDRRAAIQDRMERLARGGR